MTLNYITKMLIYNEKRCKMRVDERTIAGDGFMLNLLTVLQELCVKVNDKIFIELIHLHVPRLSFFRSKWKK